MKGFPYAIDAARTMIAEGYSGAVFWWYQVAAEFYLTYQFWCNAGDQMLHSGDMIGTPNSSMNVMCDGILYAAVFDNQNDYGAANYKDFASWLVFWMLIRTSINEGNTLADYIAKCVNYWKLTTYAGFYVPTGLIATLDVCQCFPCGQGNTNEYFSVTDNQCDCKDGYERIDNRTRDCVKKCDDENKYLDQVSGKCKCVPPRDYDPADPTKTCKCQGVGEAWNPHTQECEQCRPPRHQDANFNCVCPEGTTWNPTTQTCDKNTNQEPSRPTVCPPGQVPDTGAGVGTAGSTSCVCANTGDPPVGGECPPQPRVPLVKGLLATGVFVRTEVCLLTAYVPRHPNLPSRLEQRTHQTHAQHFSAGSAIARP